MSKRGRERPMMSWRVGVEKNMKDLDFRLMVNKEEEFIWTTTRIDLLIHVVDYYWLGYRQKINTSSKVMMAF